MVAAGVGRGDVDAGRCRGRGFLSRPQGWRTSFPKGGLAIRLRDKLGPVFQGADFIGAFGVRGKPGMVPSPLMLFTILQFVERLTDRQAVAAGAGRIDWEYALGLELDGPGFDNSVLAEFRTRLVRNDLARLAFDRRLDHCRGLGLVKADVDVAVLDRIPARLSATGSAGFAREARRVARVSRSWCGSTTGLVSASVHFSRMIPCPVTVPAPSFLQSGGHLAASPAYRSGCPRATSRVSRLLSSGLTSSQSVRRAGRWWR
jgi:transposase